MFKVIYIFAVAITIYGSFVNANQLCSYWCEATCAKKITSFYCCSYEGSLTGRSNLEPPPCADLCDSRLGNGLAQGRNCQEENALNRPITCKNFKDCDSTIHDGCCRDYCLPNGVKKCVKL